MFVWPLLFLFFFSQVQIEVIDIKYEGLKQVLKVNIFKMIKRVFVSWCP